MVRTTCGPCAVLAITAFRAIAMRRCAVLIVNGRRPRTITSRSTVQVSPAPVPAPCLDGVTALEPRSVK